ncbi:unnamed protein product [Paramecium primaurelia]|uniref:WD40-repeat-containing domain n=1 Tax=Paramecium primaurelia TaxID=5886 RepID=A0A8S1QNL0_PARPR|nr:unnamed protein product [Paramecium primaurelia]
MQKPKMIENEKDFLCSKGHKLQVVTIALDPKIYKNIRLLCIECLENTEIVGQAIGLKKIISEIEQNQIKKMEKGEDIIKNYIKLIQSLQIIVDQMKSHVMQQLGELNTIMIGWIKNLEQQKQQYFQYSFFQELEIKYYKSNQTDPNLHIHEIQKTNLCWNQKFNLKLEQFNQFIEYNKCKEILKNLELVFQKCIQNDQQQLINIQQQNQDIEQPSTQNNIQPFTYQLIKQQSILQTNQCGALAINKDCSILVAGSDSQINVFEFQQGFLKHIQSLSEHKSEVNTLNFMKQSDQFISGSDDQSIIIWGKSQNKQWISKQKLIGHGDKIQCLVLNNNEDLIVSGSSDKSIKFWIKKNEWIYQQTNTNHNNTVYQLSLNQQQNRLVSCGLDSLILILEKSEQNKQWILKQKIKVDQCGFRICFIDNNMFTFSPHNKEQVSVYELKNNQFTKTKDIAVKCGSDANCLFPQQFINAKCMLVSKNGEYVNLIRKNENGDLFTYQSIHFGTYYLYGVMSENGQYLITWDYESKQIQIRKYQEQ